ncbi:sensor histidine kinase [Paenibacillus montanisoli]|uniref:sensor histidine kinase n=1 Tax=Paenibacillus montanisoli TaxID=2081970 RepID=UPI001403D2A7|nr:sensor histidine kinase [Paenibacillus montanisoli]
MFYTRIIWVLLHLFLLGYAYKTQDWTWYVVLLSCLFVGVIPQLVWMKTLHKPSWAYPVTELLFGGLFLISASYAVGQYFSYLAIPAMCAAAVTPSSRIRIPLWIWFSIIPAIAMAVVRPLSSFTMSIIEGFFFFGLGCGIWKILDTQRKMLSLLEENERQRQVLEHYAKQVESITLLEERNRLARELHDTIGHTLTSVIVGLDALSYIIAEAPEEAPASINQLRSVSRKGLDEMRNQIHHIAPEKGGEPLAVQLKRIAGEFAVHTGTNIEFQADGPDISVPLPITMTLVRCLQESLTNAKRHGSADYIQISLNIMLDSLSLGIQDNGRGMEEVRYGFGLSAMKERIEAYQGELKVKSIKNSGTTVYCQLPLKNRKAV